MKSPITGKNMSYSSYFNTITYKGEEITYVHICWKDIDNGETFTTTEQDEINLKRIKNEYKRISGSL